jgi:RNA polymerase sigma factor (sigma-70 family)
MNSAALQDTLQQLRDLVPSPLGDASSSDSELLGRFAAHRDEAAFAELVRRHGPLVLGVCRHVLGDVHAAEDAFQATFLLLARRAARLSRPGSLAGWLHAVAVRTARQARRTEQRRRRREQGHRTPGAASDERSWREVRELLDVELARLPETYRDPLVLCYLEGLTQAEAARQLGWSATVLRGRLERARQALGRRLVRRGLPLAALLVSVEAGSVSAALRTATLATARAALAGDPVAPAVAALAASGWGFLTAVRAKLAVGLLVVAVAVSLGVSGSLSSSDPPQAQPAPREAPAARLDLLGDPLPPDALLRLGTLRHRVVGFVSGRQALPDGKTQLTYSGNRLRWMDGATGRILDAWTLPKEQTVCGVAPDGRRMLVADVNAKTLQLWDVAARKELQAFLPKGDLGLQVSATFAPDGRNATTSHGVNHNAGLLRVWDVATGQELWQEGVMGFFDRGVSSLGFLADRHTLVVHDWSTNDISLRNRWTGEERRSFPTMPRNDSRMYGLAPDGKTVFMGTAGTAVRAWDVATGAELPSLGGHQGQARTFAVAADSKTVLTGGQDPFLLVWDWPAATLRRRIDLPPARQLGSLRVSADGQRAEVSLWAERRLRFFDLATGREVTPDTGGHGGQVHGVAIAPNGQVVSAGNDNTIRVWDLATGREVRAQRTEYPVGPMTLALRADGRVVATGEHNHGAVQLHDRDTGRLLRTIESGETSVSTVAFAPVGRLLAVSGSTRQPGGAGSASVTLWDAESGRALWRVEKANAHDLAFDPDGSLLAAAVERRARIWEVPGGRERRAPPGPCYQGLAFSPDGRTLAYSDGKGTSLWEMATGKERCRLEGVARPHGALRFSPDGLLVAADDYDELAIALWDARDGRRIHAFAGHEAPVLGLAFTPDGSRLVSSSYDTTLLVWDLAGVRARLSARSPAPKAEAIRSAWSDLDREDARVAYQAVRLLAEAPALSLPLLRKQLTPAAAGDTASIDRWIADLSRDAVADRERATRELERQGEQAEDALRRALAAEPSAEARRRIEELLARIEGPVTDPERLRQIRALEVLEFLGTAEARQVLRTLAGGAADAPLTRDALAAERRLERRR